MPIIKIELDRATYRLLVKQSVQNLRPVAWEAEHILMTHLREGTSPIKTVKGKANEREA